MTHRRFTGDTLVIATHNQGKVAEISRLLSGHVTHFPTAGALGLPEPEETGLTFAENAALKARAAAEASSCPALADDSGLCVDALEGQPGIYSARWAGADRNFHAAFARIEDGLRDAASRRACFTASLALAWPDGHAELFEASLYGTLTKQPRGLNGFGYDAWFIPEGHDRTFGEMLAEEKTAISHRTLAFRKLVQDCFGGDA